MAFLSGFGAWIPERVVSNEHLAARLGCEPDWIYDVSGIRERRYAPEDVGVVDMAARAAEDCLSRTGTERSRIGMVLVASGSGERRFPGPAAEVAHRLGLADRPAVDLPMASAGSLFGMALASRMAGSSGDVLVIGAEKMSGIVEREPLDRNVAILFGDGAGACLISAASGQAAIADSILRSDGSFTESLKLEFSGPLVMNGRSVILQAARKLPKALTELLARNGIEPGTVGVYLLHQANRNLTNKVADSIGVDAAKFYSNIERRGNTSSASLLIAASEWEAAGGSLCDAPLVFGGFGAGFHWGALLVLPATHMTFRREELLAQLEAIVANSEDRTAQLQRAAELLRRAGGHRWVGLYGVDRTAGMVRNLVWSGSGAPAHPVFSTEEGLTSAAVASGKTVNIGDVTADPRYLTAFGATRSEIIVPIFDKSDENVIGTIDIESEFRNAFDNNTQEFLEACSKAIQPLWVG